MMARNISYVCDCCNKKLFKESELTWITVYPRSGRGCMNKEVCHECWEEYVNRLAEVYEDMFKCK